MIDQFLKDIGASVLLMTIGLEIIPMSIQERKPDRAD